MKYYVLPIFVITVTAFALKQMWQSAHRPPTEIRLVKEVNPYDEDDWDWVPEDTIDALQQL